MEADWLQVYPDGNIQVSDTTGKVIKAGEDTAEKECAGTSKGMAETTGRKGIKTDGKEREKTEKDQGAGPSKGTGILKKERISTSLRDQVNNRCKKCIIKYFKWKDEKCNSRL